MPGRRSLQELAGHHHALDLVGALVNLGDSGAGAVSATSALSDTVRPVVAVNSWSWSTGVSGHNRALPRRDSSAERLLTGQGARATAPRRRRVSSGKRRAPRRDPPR